VKNKATCLEDVKAVLDFINEEPENKDLRDALARCISRKKKERSKRGIKNAVVAAIMSATGRDSTNENQ